MDKQADKVDWHIEINPNQNNDKNLKIDPSAFKYLPFAIIGLAITVFLIWEGKSRSSNALFPAFILAVILIAITAIAAYIVRKVYPYAESITGRTLVLSYVITVLTIVLEGYRTGWLMVMLIFAPITLTPVLLAFSLLWSKIFTPHKRHH